MLKLIGFASFKSGAGKTTALVATSSALVAHGLKVGLFEADESQPHAAHGGQPHAVVYFNQVETDQQCKSSLNHPENCPRIGE